jgi:hypothetical protein
LGSDAWAYWLVQQKILEGLSIPHALEYMFDMLKHVHTHIDVYPVEEQSVSILDSLRHKNISTICLTGRPANMVDITHEQLSKTGYTLNSPDQFKNPMTLKMRHPVEMVRGIICGGMNEKGEVLSHIFEKFEPDIPSHVVFVDDRKSCVESIQKTCSDGGIHYTGMRYGYLDNMAKQFSPQRAAEQMTEFLKRHAFSK